MSYRPGGLASRVLGLVGSFTLAMGVLAAAPVSADGPYGLFGHSGRRGVHTLIDTAAYQGATCRYTGGGAITGVVVRQPIVFARSGIQTVGWRFQVQFSDGGTDGPWTTSFTSSTVKANATTAAPAVFAARSRAISATHDLYRIAVTVFWYTNNAQSGKAGHRIYYYRETGAGSFTNTRFCPGDLSGTSALIAGGAVAADPSAVGITTSSGDVGVNTLIDNGEYGAVSCTYDGADNLFKLGVRQPIVFSFKPQQTVGWRFTVQRWNGSAWRTEYTSSVVKETASRTRPASFAPRSFSFNSNGFSKYRVLVALTWYFPNGSTRVGTVTTLAHWYLQDGIMVPSRCARHIS